MNAAERKVAMLAGTAIAEKVAHVPLLRLAVRFWPITLLAGTALGVRLWKRHQDNELTLYNAITDSASLIAPWGSVALLSEFAMRHEERKHKLPDSARDPNTAASYDALPPPTSPV